MSGLPEGGYAPASLICAVHVAERRNRPKDIQYRAVEVE